MHSINVEEFNKERSAYGMTFLVKFSAVAENGVELKSATGEFHLYWRCK